MSGQGKGSCGRISFGRGEIIAIYFKKNRCGDKRSPLVSIHKWVILDDGKRVGRRYFADPEFFISVTDLGSRQGRIQEPIIPSSGQTTKFGEKQIMKGEDRFL